MVAQLTDPQIVVRGDQFDLPMTYSQDGVAIDLTGYTITGKLRWDGGEIDLTEGNGGIVVVDADAGRFKTRVSEANTALLPLDKITKLSVRVVDTLDDAKTLAVIWIRAIE
jgi:hypothetical protein